MGKKQRKRQRRLDLTTSTINLAAAVIGLLTVALAVVRSGCG